MNKKYPLEGIKVVDFSWYFTGPIAAKFLGDHGAEVIKVESSRRADGTRMLTPFKDNIRGINRSGVFANFNSSKMSATINLTHPRGQEVARKLVARSDVVIETFGPGVMKGWGLHYEELRKVRPDVIMLSMSMFGQYGPQAKQPTFGQLLQGSGFVHLLGWPDRPPVLPVAAYTDFIAPWFVVMMIASALDYRRRTGKGQYIDLAMQEASMHFLTPTLLDYSTNGRVQGRRGNSQPAAAPHGIYPCRLEDGASSEVEGWCAISVFNDDQWHALCKVMNNPGWTSSPEFGTMLGRLHSSGDLDSLIASWTAVHTRAEIISVLQETGVSCGIVQTGQDLVDNDLQLKHRDHFVALDHTEMGRHLSERPPYVLSKTPSQPRSPAPCFGEHTEYVCCELLGMSDEEFALLVAEDVLA